MIRTTISKIRRVCTVSFVPRLLQGSDIRIPLSHHAAVGKFEKSPCGFQSSVSKSTKAGDGSPQVPSQGSAKENSSAEHSSTKYEAQETIARETSSNDDIWNTFAGPDVNQNEPIHKPTSTICRHDDCSKIIEGIFGDGTNTLPDDNIFAPQANMIHEPTMHEPINAISKSSDEAELVPNSTMQYGIFDDWEGECPEYCTDLTENNTLAKDSFKSVLCHEAVIINGKEETVSVGSSYVNLHDSDPDEFKSNWSTDANLLKMNNQSDDNSVDSYWTDIFETVKEQSTPLKVGQAIDEDTLKIYKCLKKDTPIYTDKVILSKKMKHTQEELDRILFGNPYEHDFVKNTTSTKQDEEKLIQKIEHIEETPLVEAQNSKVDGLSVGPKVLGNLDTSVSFNRDDKLDEIAIKCINSPSDKVDEILQKEIKEMGVPQGRVKISARGNVLKKPKPAVLKDLNACKDSKPAGVSIKTGELDINSSTLQAEKTSLHDLNKTKIANDSQNVMSTPGAVQYNTNNMVLSVGPNKTTSKSTSKKPIPNLVDPNLGKDQIDPKHVLACNEACAISPKAILETPLDTISIENKNSVIETNLLNKSKQEKPIQVTSEKQKPMIETEGASSPTIGSSNDMSSTTKETSKINKLSALLSNDTFASTAEEPITDMSMSNSYNSFPEWTSKYPLLSFDAGPSETNEVKAEPNQTKLKDETSMNTANISDNTSSNRILQTCIISKETMFPREKNIHDTKDLPKPISKNDTLSKKDSLSEAKAISNADTLHKEDTVSKGESLSLSKEYPYSIQATTPTYSPGYTPEPQMFFSKPSVLQVPPDYQKVPRIQWKPPDELGTTAVCSTCRQRHILPHQMPPASDQLGKLRVQWDRCHCSLGTTGECCLCRQGHILPPPIPPAPGKLENLRVQWERCPCANQVHRQYMEEKADDITAYSKAPSLNLNPYNPHFAEFFKHMLTTSKKLQATTEKIQSTTEKIHTTSEKLHATTQQLLATSAQLHASTEKLQKTNERILAGNLQAITHDKIDLADGNLKVAKDKIDLTCDKMQATNDNIQAIQNKIQTANEKLDSASMTSKAIDEKMKRLSNVLPGSNEDPSKVITRILELYSNKDSKLKQAETKKATEEKLRLTEQPEAQNMKLETLAQQSATLTSPVAQTNEMPELKPLPKLDDKVKLSELMQLVRERHRLLYSPRIYSTAAVQKEEVVDALRKNIPPLSQPMDTKVYRSPGYPPQFQKSFPRVCAPSKKKSGPKKTKCSLCDLKTLGLDQLLEPGVTRNRHPNFPGIGGQVSQEPHSITITSDVPNSADLTEEIILQLRTIGDVLKAAYQHGKLEALEAAVVKKSHRARRLNRSKDFTPWNSIPSWPYIKKHERPRLQTPQEGNIVPPPMSQLDPPRGLRPCDNLPFPIFPKRRCFSMLDIFTVSLKDHKVI